MGEKTWRNLGSPLLSNLNWVLALLLFGFGFLFLHFPRWTGDASPTSAPQTAAILIGALWGSAALLFGAQINEWIRRREDERKLKLNMLNLDNTLLIQFIYILDKLSWITNYVKHYLDAYPVFVQKNFDYLQLKPICFVFSDIIYKQMLSLDRKKIAVILDFDRSIVKLRENIDTFQRVNLENHFLSVFNITDDLEESFKKSLNLAEYIWKNEVIHLTKEMKIMNKLFLIKNLDNNNFEYDKNITKYVRECVNYIEFLQKEKMLIIQQKLQKDKTSE